MPWFKRSKPEAGGADNQRYAGKPLLLLLENYVLDSIGQLPPDKQQNMAVVVQRVYDGGPDWKATLRSTIALEDSLDENLRRMWSRNQEIARQNRVTLAPDKFARMVVDQNFAHLLNRGGPT